MKAIKKILMGISLILLGISIAIGGTVGTGVFTIVGIGWAVSLVGLIMSFIGCYFTENE